jgi:TetR/AcrR family transcriptional repressor of lmrAB and yxaGH operons
MTPRERIVEATITALRSAGLAGASIGHVLEASGAPRGSLYHYFPQGKQQIVRESLGVYGERVRQYIEATLSSAATPGAKVRALFSAVARRLESADFGLSCAAGAVALDLTDTDEQVRADVAALFASWVDVIARHLSFASEARQRAFAGVLLTAIEGGYVVGRAERSTRALDEAGEWLARLADSEAGPAS